MLVTGMTVILIIYNLYTGLTSYGFGCASKGLLGVYTDVSYFVDWINNKSNLSCGSNVTCEGNINNKTVEQGR